MSYSQEDQGKLIRAYYSSEIFLLYRLCAYKAFLLLILTASELAGRESKAVTFQAAFYIVHV